MAYLSESSVWSEGIYRLELTDPVVGGEDGISNTQAKQLANRTVYLKDQIEDFLSSTSAGIVDRVVALEEQLDASSSTSLTTKVQQMEATVSAASDTASRAASAADTATNTLTSVQSAITTNTANISWLTSCMLNNSYIRPHVMVAGNSAGSNGCNLLTIPAGTIITINGSVYTLLTDRVMNVYESTDWADTEGSTYSDQNNRCGKDFYVYACAPDEGTTPKFVFSINSTYPSGYTEEEGVTKTRKIGGFHTMNISPVGEAEGHNLKNFIIGDIIPNSVWDLKYRPVSAPEGMVCVGGRFWADIYLPSLALDGSGRLVSRYLGDVVDGASTTKFHAEKFVEKFAEIGKRLPTRDEFIAMSALSNQGTSIKQSVSGEDGDAGSTGGHTDSAGTRMLSTWGIEDCCGYMWQWTSDIFGAFNQAANADTTQYGGQSLDGTYNLMGYSQDNSSLSIYSEVVDGTTTSGGVVGALVRAKVGGYWGTGTASGSRAVDLSSLSSQHNANTTGRGVSEFKHPEVN